MSMEEKEEIREQVRERYAQVAQGDRAGCGCTAGCCGSGPAASSCCGAGSVLVACCEPPEGEAPAASGSVAMGYASAALDAIPEGADMGLGCGNPQAIAALKPGETVLDLGCGGGVDCFLAAQAVGESGQVIGVDMTPEMVRRARMNARQGAYDNVAFRLGEIEHLPVADASVDVIISNCVINLSPDKPQVLREAYRVLRPGGRLAFSDIVATAEMPQAIKEDVASYTGCVAGAASLAEWETILADSGFTGVEITCDEESRSMIAEWFPGSGAEEYVVSASIVATK